MHHHRHHRTQIGASIALYESTINRLVSAPHQHLKTRDLFCKFVGQWLAAAAAAVVVLNWREGTWIVHRTVVHNRTSCRGDAWTSIDWSDAQVGSFAWSITNIMISATMFHHRTAPFVDLKPVITDWIRFLQCIVDCGRYTKVSELTHCVMVDTLRNRQIKQ